MSKLSTMNSTALRQRLHEFIDQIEDKKAKAIYTLFEEEINQAHHISLEQYNNELAEAESEYKAGKHISHEAMQKKVKQW